MIGSRIENPEGLLRSAGLLLMALSLSQVPAGAYGQDTDRPRAREADASGIPRTGEEASGAAEERGARTVRTVSLEEALELALVRNPTLREADSNVEIAGFDRLDAYGGFLPDLNLGYGYSNASTGRLDPTNQAFSRTSYTVQLGASYDLFTGLRRFNELKSARRSVDAEEARYRERRFQIILQVTTTYYDAVASRELVQVERDRIRRQEDQLELVRNQMELGRATRSDLLRSRIDLNQAELALLNAENEARVSTFALAEAMGVSERVSPEPEAGLMIDSLSWSRNELVRAALENGPEVASARAAADAAEAAIGSARSSYLPNLTFRGGWAWQNTEFPAENRSWSISLSGNYPLFNGFQRETTVYRARARANAATERERAAELAIRSDVDEAFSRMRSARAGVDLAERTVELAREDLQATSERFRLGLATILDLQSAQITLRQAEADLIRRRFDHQVSVARLEALVGRSLRPASSDVIVPPPDRSRP